MGHAKRWGVETRVRRASRWARALGVVLGSVALTAAAQGESRADGTDSAEGKDYVECRWTPFDGAWACGLPATFTEGRFGPPPEFKHDAASEESRRHAYATAKAVSGARSRGRVGVFVPEKDGAWLFVPGTAWSPGEPVFLPPPSKSATNPRPF